MRALLLSIAATGAMASSAHAYTVTSSNTLPIHATSPHPTSSTPTVKLDQTGSITNVERSPYEGTKYDGTGEYTAILSTGSATFDFTSKTPLTELSLIWGSPDKFNELQFFSGLDGTGSSQTVFGNNAGIQVFNGAGNPISPTNPASGYSFVKISGLDPFESIKFTNNPNQNAFEISAVSAVPLPASAALFGLALSVMGGFGYFKRNKQAAAAAA